MSEAIAVVICAAGSSLRMGGIKKEYLKLKEQRDSFQALTVLGAGVRAFAAVPDVGIIVIAINEGTEAAAREALPSEYLPGEKPKIIFVNGGNSRSISVYNALSALVPHNPCYVLIHDGARPWVNTSLIERVITAVKKHGAVIPLLPLTETPKECDAPLCEFSAADASAVFINKHLKRMNIGAAQTPQAFKFPDILYGHEKAAALNEQDFTDDAEIWGRFCGQVAAIPGDPENRKITFPEDL